MDLSDLDDLLVWVDKIDSGGITREEYLSDHPAIWLGRVIDVGEGTAMSVLESLQRGEDTEAILCEADIAARLTVRRAQRVVLSEAILERVYVDDRLAIARLDDLGMRSNGYHVTALVGDACDACVIVHGNVGAIFGDEGRYPVSASFYTNSFLHPEGGICDLTRLATRFDPDGGGHANACGCRIQPLKDGERDSRKVVESDIEANLTAWLGMWAER
jgi:nanoRNase/pAp phosphatase (c-di-AMP/oligoRNAs hydrolase)